MVPFSSLFFFFLANLLGHLCFYGLCVTINFSGSLAA